MKQKRLVLLAAAVAVMLAACEPEQVVTPEPERTPHLAGGYGVESPCGFLDDSVRS